MALVMVLSAILMMMKGGQSVYCKFMTMLKKGHTGKDVDDDENKRN